MTKADLIDEVSRLAELTRKDSEVIVETIFDSVVRSLRAGDKIEIRGFGSFRTRQRKPRVGRNPKTGERVEVPAKKIPFFKPSKELKDLVNDSGMPRRSLRLRRRRRHFCATYRLSALQFVSRDLLAASLFCADSFCQPRFARRTAEAAVPTFSLRILISQIHVCDFQRQALRIYVAAIYQHDDR